MIIEIVMPKMGESITEGTILEWRKKVGEFVEKDQSAVIICHRNICHAAIAEYCLCK